MPGRQCSEIELQQREKKKAQRRGNAKEVATICNTLGQLYFDTGDFENALQEHRLELSSCEETSDNLGIAVAHRRIGECLVELNQYEDAVKHAELYLSLAASENDNVEVQRAHATIGRIYFVLSDDTENGFMPRCEALRRAKIAYERSYDICEQLVSQLVPKEYGEMKCRLLLNLGLTEEAFDRIDSAISKFCLAISVANNYQLKEDEYSIYLALIATCQRDGRVDVAMKHLNALMEREHVSRDKEKMCCCYNTLALVYVQQNRCYLATEVLKKASQSFAGNKGLLKATTKLRKQIAKFDKSMKLFIEASNTADNEAKLSLCDQLADRSYKLGLFRTAIEFYCQELDIAADLRKCDKDLAKIYVSLAVTAFEDKRYSQAVEYYLLELQHRADDSAQACQTWLKIAEAQMQIDDYAERALESLSNAQQMAEKTGKLQLKKQVLQAQSYCLQLHGKTETLSEVNAQIESLVDVSEEEAEDEIGEVDEILSSSDSSDGENVEEDASFMREGEGEDAAAEPAANGTRSRSSQSRRQAVAAKQWKKNHFGETPLHVACIQGNSKSVKNLLAAGHPLLVRDHSGWTPLHEAANNGHCDIVTLLLAKGAPINDKGGPECQGITPLHDACDNGHLDIVLVLLEHGADVKLKNAAGDLPYDRLKAWWRANHRTATESVSDVKHAFRELYKRTFGQDLGDGVDAIVAIAAEARGNNDGDQSEEINSQSERNEDSLPVDNDVILQVADNPAKASQAYRTAISSVGSARNAPITSRAKSRKRKRDSAAALIYEDDYVRDDWLVSDMKDTRRSSAGIENLWSSLAVNKRRSSRQKQATKRRRPTSMQVVREEGRRGMNTSDVEFVSSDEDAAERVEDEMVSAAQSESLPPAENGGESLLHNSSFNSRRDRSRLSLASFSAHTESNNLPPSQVDRELSLTSRSAPAASVVSMKLKVRIEERLVLVPVLEDSATVGWLSEEAAERYFKSFHLKPRLLLTTKDGAHLAADDCLRVLFSDNDEVCGVVLGWNLLPISDRYRNACARLNVVQCNGLLLKLEAATSLAAGSLNLDRLSLKSNYFASVADAIAYDSALREIHLHGNCIGDVGADKLGAALQDLSNVTVLDLGSNGITCRGLQALVDAVQKKPGCLSRLTQLALSYNPLGDSCASALVSLLQRLSALATLKLSSCGLTVNFFADHRAALSAALAAGQLQEIDISYNDLGCTGVEMLVRCLKQAPSLAVMNLTGTQSRSSSSSSGCNALLVRHIEQALASSRLRELHLADCSLGDEHFNDLCKILPKLAHLTTLSLDCNLNLNEKHLAPLLQCSAAGNCALESLSFVGCGVEELDSAVVDALAVKLQASCPLRCFAADSMCAMKQAVESEVTLLWLARWPNGSARVDDGYVVELFDSEQRAYCASNNRLL